MARGVHIQVSASSSAETSNGQRTLDFLFETKKNVRNVVRALEAIEGQHRDRHSLDSLDGGLREIAQAAERAGFANLCGFVGDLQGFASLLRDRMARVDDTLAYLQRAMPILQGMADISTAGLDHAHRDSGDILAELASAGPKEVDLISRGVVSHALLVRSSRGGRT